MKFLKVALLLLITVNFANAQNQKLTMAEAVNGLRSNLAVKNISQFSWLEDGKSYTQAVKNGYLITDIKTGKSDTLVSLYQVNKNLGDSDKLKSLPTVKFQNASKGSFSKGNQYYWL